jgi:uncharacterized membrane protein YdfJ with MMPL/SSD domain
MFRAIGKFSVKFRWPIVIFWIAMVPITGSLFPNINDVTKNNVSDFLPKNSPTSVGANLEQSFQKKDTATNSVIVVGRNGTLTAADQAAMAKLVENVIHVKDITEVKDLGPSAERRHVNRI